jgi:hypothetical protein
MSDVGIFRGLITENDNRTISPTFSAVWFAVYVVLPMVILLLTALAFVDVVVNEHDANVGGLGGGIAAVIAAVGAFISGLALLLSQDKKPDPPITTTTTTTTATGPAVITGGQVAPLKVDVVDMPDAKESRGKAKKT